MTDSIILSRTIAPPPKPALNQLGDDGACVLAGLLEVTVANVYAEYGSPSRITEFNYQAMRSALLKANTQGFLDRVIVDNPFWVAERSMTTFGLPAYLQVHGWFGYVRMAIDAGYYGLALVDNRRRGPNGPGANHWVLVRGARHREERTLSGGAVLHHNEIFVSSPAVGEIEGWIEVAEFLTRHGGFNLFLARPT